MVTNVSTIDKYELCQSSSLQKTSGIPFASMVLLRLIISANMTDTMFIKKKTHTVHFSGKTVNAQTEGALRC